MDPRKKKLPEKESKTLSSQETPEAEPAPKTFLEVAEAYLKEMGVDVSGADLVEFAKTRSRAHHLTMASLRQDFLWQFSEWSNPDQGKISTALREWVDERQSEKSLLKPFRHPEKYSDLDMDDPGNVLKCVLTEIAAEHVCIDAKKIAELTRDHQGNDTQPRSVSELREAHARRILGVLGEDLKMELPRDFSGWADVSTHLERKYNKADFSYYRPQTHPISSVVSAYDKFIRCSVFLIETEKMSRTFIEEHLWMFQTLRVLSADKKLKDLLPVSPKTLDAALKVHGFRVADGVYVRRMVPGAEALVAADAFEGVHIQEKMKPVLDRLYIAGLKATELQEKTKRESREREVAEARRIVEERAEALNAFMTGTWEPLKKELAELERQLALCPSWKFWLGARRKDISISIKKLEYQLAEKTAQKDRLVQAVMEDQDQTSALRAFEKSLKNTDIPEEPSETATASGRKKREKA